MTQPHSDDVVVWQKRGNPSVVYRLGTPSGPDQLIVRNRNEAVAQALKFAEHQHVDAWFVKNDEFVLLGAFRQRPGGTLTKSAPNQRCETRGGSLAPQRVMASPKR